MKGAVVVAMAAAVVGAPMGSALATSTPVGELTVSPKSVTEGSTTEFQLTYTTTGGNGVKCILFAIDSAFTGVTAVPPPVSPVSGWTVTDDGTDGSGNSLEKLSGTPAIGTGLAGGINVDATAPAAVNTDPGYKFSATAYTSEDCTNFVSTDDAYVTTTSSAPPAVPGNFKPDNLIRKAKPGSRWFGEGIFNGTGRRQRVHDYARVGTSHTFGFYIQVENDGNTVDNIVVGGRGLQHGYRVVKYTFRGKNITRKVTGHGYTFAHMAPGSSRTIKLTITSFRTAGASFRTWQVISRSTGNPFKRDTVAATITLRR